MSQRRHKIAELLVKDSRYEWEAYQFIEEALQYTQQSLGRTVTPGEEPTDAQHLTARELCNGLRDLAAERWGPLAGAVLREMRVRTSDDVGELVWNLVTSGLLLKSEKDRKEDFQGLVDFSQAFKDLDLTLPENAQEVAREE
jgi:uncharacterized repeat protein (TIGR04138 family)